jgi:hypothetical protein
LLPLFTLREKSEDSPRRPPTGLKQAKQAHGAPPTRFNLEVMFVAELYPPQYNWSRICQNPSKMSFFSWIPVIFGPDSSIVKIFFFAPDPTLTTNIQRRNGRIIDRMYKIEK